MKIKDTSFKEFTPVSFETILETQREVNEMCAIFNYSPFSSSTVLDCVALRTVLSDKIDSDTNLHRDMARKLLE